jgi:hypothetical protein
MKIADQNTSPVEIPSEVRVMRKRKLFMGVLLLLSCISSVRVAMLLEADDARSPWLAVILVVTEYAAGYKLLNWNKMAGTVFLATAGILFSMGTGLLSGILGFALMADPLKAGRLALYLVAASFILNIGFLFGVVRYQTVLKTDLAATDFAIGCGSALDHSVGLLEKHPALLSRGGIGQLVWSRLTNERARPKTALPGDGLRITSPVCIFVIKNT